MGTIAVPALRMLLPGSMQPPLLQFLGKVSNFYYGFIGALLTVIVGYAASLWFPAPPVDRIAGLTRRNLPAPIESRVAVKVN